MSGTEPGCGAPSRRFFADVIVPTTGRQRYEAFLRTWEERVGEAYPLPPTEPTKTGDFRLSICGFRMPGAVIADLYNGSAVAGGTGGDFHHFSDLVVVHVVERGAWHFSRPRSRDQVAVSAGQFIVRNNGLSWRFAVEPHTTVKKLNLPIAHLGALIGERPFLGSADSAEMRLLLAHARMIDASLDDLTPSGARAARNALIELVRGVLTQQVDGTEPQLAPSLVQAAKDLVDAHLADPELSPSMLARKLSVSVRTLHRAFAATDESVAEYIRHQRLDQARLALTTPFGRPSVSEVAAYWQFTDSSHFIRAFRKRYGRTPAQYARSHDRTAASRPQ